MEDSADHELTFVSLSGPAEALPRATERGSGMLATGRPWVRQEGWLLKESSGLGGGWQLRYFVVAGDRLEYFKEEVTKLSLRPGERLGVDVDKGNLVSRAAPGGAAASQRALAENDVVIGHNGESLVRTPFSAALDAQRRAGAANLAFRLRPKGRSCPAARSAPAARASRAAISPSPSPRAAHGRGTSSSAAASARRRLGRRSRRRSPPPR